MAVHRVAIQLRRPSGPDDPGAAAAGCYVVEGGDMVVLTDRDGVPLVRERGRATRGEPVARYARKLRAGEDAYRAARDLLMQKHVAAKRGSDFSRPLRYSNAGVV
jgi:hypothetical protein